MSCDVSEATEGLVNELWHRWSYGKVGEWALLFKWRACDVGEAKEGLGNELWRRWRDRKLWRIRVSCNVGGVTESLENELCYDYNYELCSFSKLSVTSHTSQLILILQDFRHFTYVTAHCPTLPSLYLRHNSFFNPSIATPTSQLILQPFFRLSYVTEFSLTSPGEPPMATGRSTRNINRNGRTDGVLRFPNI